MYHIFYEEGSATNAEEKHNILDACHMHATAGHLGKSRTIYRINVGSG